MQLYLVRTLHQLVAAREPSAGNKVCTRDYLSDDDFSAILDFCLTVMMSSGGLKRTLILHQEAEQTVGEIARFLTCRLSLSVSVSRSDGNSTALCRIVEYLTAILRAAAHDQPLQRGLGSGSGQGESISASSSATVSQKSSQPPPLGLGLGDGSLDADTAHLIFALKSLQALVTCWSDLAAAQKLLTGLPRLYYLLCDDLGSALLSLSCKRDKFPPIVLQLSLTLFSALYAVCAPGMRVLLECFMKQMYIKALHQAVEIFMAQVRKPLIVCDSPLLLLLHAIFIDSISVGSAGESAGSLRPVRRILVVRLGPSALVRCIVVAVCTIAAEARGRSSFEDMYMRYICNDSLIGVGGGSGELVRPAGGRRLPAGAVRFVRLRSHSLRPRAAHDSVPQSMRKVSISYRSPCLVPSFLFLNPLLILSDLLCLRIVLNSASEELGPNRELGVLVVQAYKQVRRAFHFLSSSLISLLMSI